MRLSYEPITLTLETPFRIAHGTSITRHNVLLHLAHEEQEGIGEAAPVRQHQETQLGVLDYLAALADAWPAELDPCLLEDLLGSLPPGSQAGRAAVDIALHDLWGKQLINPT
jgi:L-alanine-DL-glutamate epimerase-like enolase superfamily enzyme